MTLNPDDFSTTHFGFSVWRTDDATVGPSGCYCLLADADDTKTIRSAEAKGFRTVDIRVHLERRAYPLPLQSAVRSHRKQDIQTLARIARESHRITRFYADPHFPDDKCDDYYEQWIRNSADGWSRQTLVWDTGDGPQGYCTIHRGDDRASIGLIAVAGHARGQHIGSALVRRAVDFSFHDGARRVSVVTQGRNLAALRLFQSCGFKIAEVGVWMHRFVS